jgi:ribonuclease HII
MREILLPDFTCERELDGLVVGFDEVGCGPWAGPVMVAAVVFKTYDLLPEILALIEDSKQLTKLKRELAFSRLHEMKGRTCEFAIARAEVEEIDTHNIRQATMIAMARAYELLPLKPDAALVDGMSKPRLPVPVRAIKKGDSKSFSIAAASILAKVTRDQVMAELAREFPHYGWEHNAGYGTKEHQQALKLYGVTPHHRRSFAPIADLLKAA